MTISFKWLLTHDKSLINKTVINADGVQISGLTVIKGDHAIEINKKAKVTHNHVLMIKTME